MQCVVIDLNSFYTFLIFFFVSLAYRLSVAKPSQYVAARDWKKVNIQFTCMILTFNF